MASPAHEVEGLEVEDDHAEDAKVQLPLLLCDGGHIRTVLGCDLGVSRLLCALHFMFLHFTVCTALHYNVNTRLLYTALHCTVLYCSARYCNILYCTALY